MKRYEGMFLFDNTALHEWSEMEAEVNRLFDRIQAEPLVCVKFDERKLAYEIKRRKRGTYVLTYFDVDPARIADLERDARLSEVILRMMVLRTDKLSEERLAELKAHTPDQSLQPISSDGRRGEGGPYRSRTEATTESGSKQKTDADKATGGATEVVTDDKVEVSPEQAPEDVVEAPPVAEPTEGRPADE